jgi:hypothetical protein
MEQFVINGPKQLVLEAAEVATVLDSLAVQPFNKVASVVNKIMGQCRAQQEQIKDDNPKD